jgi:hypothetical protein
LLLFWRGLQLDFGSQFHGHIVAQHLLRVKYLKEGRVQFLPQMNPGISLRQIL